MSVNYSQLDTTKFSIEQSHKKIMPIPLAKINFPSSVRQSFNNTQREPETMNFEEIVNINKRIAILQQRKRYILKFYEKNDQNRSVLVNPNYNEKLSFIRDCISQSQRNWKYYEGQTLEGKFHGVGNLKYGKVNLHGHFANGLAEGQVSIYENDQLIIAQYKQGDLVKILFH